MRNRLHTNALCCLSVLCKNVVLNSFDYNSKGHIRSNDDALECIYLLLYFTFVYMSFVALNTWTLSHTVSVFLAADRTQIMYFVLL